MRRKQRSTIDETSGEDRPRERLLGSGPGVLTDADLVAVLFGTGSAGEGVVELSARVTSAIPLRQLHRVPVEELLQIRGMGQARAAQLLAAAELGRRLWPDGDAAALVRGPETVFDATFAAPTASTSSASISIPGTRCCGARSSRSEA